ncbi:MAG: phosphoenolpyruvate carboxykinase (GTP) [Thermoplasmata archaeon]|nr:MAG: phosphoenolpyruvate carboxykinase (GTP) [Aciduliprofundum sp.]
MEQFFKKFEKRYDMGELNKLRKIDNGKLFEFLEFYMDLLKPSSIFVVSDDPADADFVKNRAVGDGEEGKLKKDHHTYHFDNYYDQARDKENTRILLGKKEDLPFLNVMGREEGLKEIHELLRNQMIGRTMYIGFFSLGPIGSSFSELAVQLTDSSYVMHSEIILYRNAYGKFVENKDAQFLKFVHSQGELDERKTSKNLKNRRIYFDLDGLTGFAVNTQYAGNTVGLKKPGFRLTISKALREGWLSEHMFLMGVNGPGGRVTYFTGAFPSMCGKTSTCTLPGERLVGDDLVFIKPVGGRARAINVEAGVFGIIDGINKKDDPIIWDVLQSDSEIIFSNVLVSEGIPYWNGMGIEIPDRGINHSGEWWKGKKDAEGKEIPPSHKNARFTVRLSSFINLDADALESKEGVEVGGIIFGGRDSDTWPPVVESFNWRHGVLKGASIESETTAATLGKEGVRTFNAMSIMEFLSVDLGKYLENYISFEKKLNSAPKIFAVNYFLRDKDGRFLNEKTDKAIWLKWMELRVHGDVDALKTPIGYIPKYEDLKRLFREIQGKDYKKEDYEKQFMLRIPELLSKNERIRRIYEGIRTTPHEILDELNRERSELQGLREKAGDYISPFFFYS